MTSQSVVLSKEGGRRVALLMNTSSKKVPSKLSQTAITEGEDILASMMDSDSSGDDFEMPTKTFANR